MRMRAELARALVSSPSLLLLDEPTNHLDLEAKDWLQSFLTQKADSGNRAVVLVSHDAAFLDAVCTHMLQLHGGSLVCTPGNYSEFEERAAQHCSWQTGLLEKTVRTTRLSPLGFGVHLRTASARMFRARVERCGGALPSRARAGGSPR
jgi:ATPase subunit of ABC transporter with duplicated ATPase domains